MRSFRRQASKATRPQDVNSAVAGLDAATAALIAATSSALNPTATRSK